AQLKAGGKGKVLAKKGKSSGETPADPTGAAAPGNVATLIEKAVADFSAATPADATATGTPAPGTEAAAPAAPNGEQARGEAPAGDTAPNGTAAGVAVTGQLNELFDRVNQLLGAPGQAEEQFQPAEAANIPDTGLTSEDIEKLILKYLLARGSAIGR